MKKQDKTYSTGSARNRDVETGSAGQSGDNQGLPSVADEGQSFEAEAIAGVENAPDPDVAEVHTRQVPEDDVPPEYQNQDR
jgi:hypothetical protein